MNQPVGSRPEFLLIWTENGAIFLDLAWNCRPVVMPASHADILRVHVRHAREDWTRDEALLNLGVGGYSKILTFKPVCGNAAIAELSLSLGAPWVIKFGYLGIRENLVITWPSVRPHHRGTIEKCPFQTTVAACNLRLIDSCQNRGSADQYHMTISRALMSTYLGYVFFQIFRWPGMSG